MGFKKVGLDWGKHWNVAKGVLLKCIYQDSTNKSYKGLIFFIGWKVGYSAGRIGQKVGAVLGESMVGSLKKMGAILGTCQDACGGHW